MQKEVFDIIKKEASYIGLLFLLILSILKTAFYNENLLILIRNTLSVFWLFALPGYFLMLYWRENLGFAERFVIGSFAAAGINGIFSYYFGLMGLNIKYHGILLPLVLIVLVLIIIYKKR